MKTSLFCGVLALLVLTVSPLSALSSVADNSGKIVFLDGDVTVNGKLADIGDKIDPVSVIKTGQKSEVEIIFADKNIFRLQANSVVKVDFSQLKRTVFLESGVFTSVLKKLAKISGDTGFELKTPTANAGIRGTSFHVMVNGNQTYFCTCNGSVALDDGKGGNFVLLTNAHHGARIFTKNDDGTTTVTEAGIQGHSDASLESLAAKIEVPIDWTQPDLKHD